MLLGRLRDSTHDLLALAFLLLLFLQHVQQHGLRAESSRQTLITLPFLALLSGWRMAITGSRSVGL